MVEKTVAFVGLVDWSHIVASKSNIGFSFLSFLEGF